MKKILIALCLSLLFCSTLYAAAGDQNSNAALSGNSKVSPDNPVVSASPTPFPADPIRIVEPGEDDHLPALASTFVCGSVPVGGKLLINGTPVAVHPGGGFLTMVNLTPGKFEIKADLQFGDQTYHFTRTIVVAAPEQAAPVSPLTIEYVAPWLDQEVLPGDNIDVVCKGSPGMKASFTVKGVRRQFPMAESAAAPGGIYEGVYQVGNKDRLNKSKFKITLINNQGQKISKETDGTLSLFPRDLPVMAETTSPDTVLRAGPALAADDKAGYLMFPPVGTILQITGSKGDEYRVRLTKTQTVWVSANQVKRLPDGTPPVHVVVGGIAVSADDRSTKIRIPLDRKIPFKIDPDVEDSHLDLTLFGAFSNTDTISNPATGVIKNIRWFQDNEETYRLRIFTIPNGWWGYDARYEGNDLVLELRMPPSVAPGSSPLTGLTIALDPGHSPDTGAIGTTGYLERDANLAQALNLKEKLLAKGVNVIMTRKGDEPVPLTERPRIAWQNKADILISLHNNALPAGGNPLIKHGFGVYYFTPMSLALAEAVHTAYGEAFGAGGEFNLRDDGLYYDNLALTRPPQMPSILIESVYMIVPEEEAYLKTDGFRSASANAIIAGLESYVRSMRPELPKPK